MQTQKYLKLLSWVFIIVGVLGFVPGITANGHLLGIFEVDTVHNVIHLLSGILGLVFAGKSARAAATYATVFGIVYGLVTILGFLMDGNAILIHTNMADNVLHLVLTVVYLCIGLCKPKGGAM